MPSPDPKPDDQKPVAIEEEVSLTNEVQLFVAFWAEIQTEMNKILAQEDD